MAYNPFDFFRRNQKTFFAFLTIVVMFMFVLQFGPGDFFSSIPKYFGGRSGDTLAVIDGSKFTEADRDDQRKKRLWANTFMEEAHRRANDRVGKFVADGQAKAGDTLKPMVQQFLETRRHKQEWESVLQINTAYLDREALMAVLQRQIPPQFLPNVQARTMDTELQKFEVFLLNSKTAKADDLELARAVQSLIQLDGHVLFPSSSYFRTVDLNRRDAAEGALAVEFELWRRKADKLGVVYTRADTERLVQSEVYDQLSKADWDAIESAMLEREGPKGFTRDKLRDALADELKVRTAMTVVLGPIRGGEDRSYSQAQQNFAAPYDQYEYYKKLCDQTNYAVIAVPVANFLDRVKEEPTEQELRALFTKYRAEEPSPDRELPGLKEPRKLKLEWLEAKGDEKYFKDKAREFLPKSEAAALLSGVLALASGPTVTGVAAAVAPLGLDQPALQAAYQEYAKQTRTNEYGAWFPFFSQRESKLADQSVVRPAVLASGAIAAAAGRMTLATPFDAVTAMYGPAMKAERDAQIAAGAALFAPPTPLTPYVVFSQASAPLPLSVVSNDLKTKVVDHYARQVAFDDLTLFETEVTKLGASKDKAPAQDYVEKFAKDRGLKAGGSKDFHDLFSLATDEGLKPLFERMKTVHAGVHFPIQFGQAFFFETDPKTGRMGPATTFYAPASYPEQAFEKFSFVGSSIADPPLNQSVYFVWRTSDLPAETPKTLDAKTREKAIAAWKRIKARDLAKERAEKLRAEAEKFGTSPMVIRQKLLDAHSALQKEFAAKEAQDKVKLFYLTNVAQLRKEFSTTPGRSMQYTEFQLRADENIPFPDRAKMQADLLGNRAKPPATAFVMADLPKDVFYVTVLESRDTKGTEEFGFEVYAPPFPDMSAGQAVLGRFRDETSRQLRDDAVALLKAEFRYDKENEKLLKKSDTSSD